jgi:hypothetical protein
MCPVWKGSREGLFSLFLLREIAIGKEPIYRILILLKQIFFYYTT